MTAQPRSPDTEPMDRIARDVAATEYADGLLEIVAGVLFLCLGALWLSSPGMLPILAALAILFGPAGINRIKRRLTYPRIGYADYPADTPIDGGGVLGFIVGGLFVTGTIVALTGGIDDIVTWRRWTALLAGILSSGGFFYAATRSGMRRYRVIGAVSIVFGLISSLLANGSDYASVGWFFVAMGTLLTVVGLREAVTFVRHHPVLEP